MPYNPTLHTKSKHSIAFKVVTSSYMVDIITVGVPSSIPGQNLYLQRWSGITGPWVPGSAPMIRWSERRFEDANDFRYVYGAE